jgi:hypothetical protein
MLIKRTKFCPGRRIREVDLLSTNDKVFRPDHLSSLHARLLQQQCRQPVVFRPLCRFYEQGFACLPGTCSNRPCLRDIIVSCLYREVKAILANLRCDMHK